MSRSSREAGYRWTAAGGWALAVTLLAAGCGNGTSEGVGTGGAATGDTGGVGSDGTGGMTPNSGGGPGTGDGGAGGTSPGAGGTLGTSGGSDGIGGGVSTAAPVFDGSSGYVEIPDADVFSEPTSGALTVEAWIRPDRTDMPEVEGTGYVHFLGKGEADQHEWVCRMYQDGNSEGRENRISFYSFNLSGGLGAGSYFQETVAPGEWIYYVGEFDAENTYIFKSGIQKDSDPLSGYSIVPENGTAPVRIATRDKNSYFEGSIARVAFYKTRLSADVLASHYAAPSADDYDALVLGEASLVAFYRLDETEGTVAHDALGEHDGSYQGGVTLAGAVFHDPGP